MTIYYVQEPTGEIVPISREKIIQDLLSPKKVGDRFYSVSELIGCLKKPMKNVKVENFIVVFVDNANTILKIEKLSEGVEDQTAVYPKQILRRCLLLCANGVVIAHNHPTGEIKPSQADRDITRKIELACKTLDVRFLDHVILGNGYFSFRENGLI